MSLAGVLTFAACDILDEAEDSVQEYCWKVTIDAGDEAPLITTYHWNTKAEIEIVVEGMKSNGYNVSYEKSSTGDADACEDLNTSSLEDLFNFKKKYEETAPGIYMKGDSLLAKGTDGSIFVVPDVNDLGSPMSEKFYPNRFEGYDGKATTYVFSMEYANDNDGNWLTQTFEDTIFYARKSEWAENGDDEVYSLDHALNALVYSYFYNISRFEKIADASDFDNTYVAIAKMVQKGGPIVKPSEMISKHTKYSPDHWLSELYPADMEAKKYVVPYTGKGSITYMSVDHLFENGKKEGTFWIPEYVQTDDVSSITVMMSDVPVDDVRAYIQKITDEVPHSEVSNDLDTGEIISFQIDSENYDEMGVVVYPQYEIAYVASTKTLSITISVRRTTLI